MTWVRSQGAALRLRPDPASAAPRARKAEIAHSFSQAAESYDEHAEVQRLVARELAHRIAALPLPRAPKVFEIGCGTGFLGEAMMDALGDRLGGGECLFTDLSPAMVEKCRGKLARRLRGARFAVIDGEAPAVARGFDLVAASMVFQWFEDLPSALPRLVSCLNPGGRLAFATLGPDSLKEWRVACAAAGLASGVPAFPSAGDFSRLWPDGAEGSGIWERKLCFRYASAHSFLRQLKAIGAHPPAPGHVLLAPGRLRSLLRGLDGKNGEGFAVTYHVLFGVHVRNREGA